MRSVKIPCRILHFLVAISSAVFLQFYVGGSSVNAQTTRFPAEIYTVEDGLSHSTVMYVVKDSCGFIWAATVNGISRFDGSRFTHYKPDFSYRYAGFIKSPEGELWAVYPDMTSLRYDFQLDTFLNPYADVIERGFPDWDHNGELWWIVDDTLYHMEERTGGSVYIRSANNTAEVMGQMDWTLKFPGGAYFGVSSSGMYRILEEGGDVQFIPYTLKAGGRELDPYSLFGTLAFFPDGDSVWMLAESRILRAALSGDPGERSVHGRIITMDRPEIRLSKDDEIIMQKWDGSEFLYFRTLHGVYRLSAVTWDVERIYEEEYGILDQKEGLFQLAMYYDPEGILWLGTDKGLVKIVVKKTGFHLIGTGPGREGGLSYPKLSAVTVDRNDQLWVGSVGGGLFRSRKGRDGIYHTFDSYLHDPADPYSIAGNGISAILEDSRGDIYISADQSTSQSEIQVIADPLDHPARFRSVTWGKCYQIAEVYQGWILINRINNLSWVYVTETGVSFPFYLDKDMSGYTDGLLVHGGENNPSSYFLTGSGLYRITGQPMYVQQNGRRYAYPEKAILLTDSLVTDYKHLPGWGTGESRANLSVDRLVYYWRSMIVTCPGDERELWICTDEFVRHFRFTEKHGEGTDPEYGDFRLVNSYGIHNGLSDERVNELIEDDQHRIWCSTQNGLTCIDPLNDRVYRFYEEDGLPTNKFYWGCHKDRYGNLYFCTNNGLVWFHPDSIVPDEKPKVYLTGLSLFNRPVHPGPGSPLEKQVMFTDHLRLPHNRNFISFEFAALDFTGTDRLEYRYMLEGLDKEWVDAGSRRTADYPGLQPGRYRFHVISSNSNGVWNMEGASLGVTITPPFWLRWWSFVIEGALLLSILFMIIRLRERNLRIRAAELEQKVEEKTREAIEQRKEVDEMKSRFYANISHEFRTPLTLMLGPLEDALRQKNSRLDFDRGVIQMMKRNAKRLQRLITQLLDISRLESGEIRVRASECDLTALARTISSSFLSLAERKKIDYRIDLEDTESPTYADSDKLEKILVNLLSNAFKYTPEGGEVTFRLNYITSGKDPDHGSAVFSIRDSGRGIAREDLPKIFDRFFHTGKGEDDSIGIGLALTREMIEILHGQISVESQIGKGTSFTVTLPVSRERYHENEIVTAAPDISPESSGMGTLSAGISEAEGEQVTVEGDLPVTDGSEDHPGTKRYEVLVVEDNSDLRNYITQQLTAYYRIRKAVNGKEGLELALANIPDLIISDLMMPVMDGMEMSKRLKDDMRTSHIPVIMLTARADKQSKMEGLETGADDYIIKPFDADELRVRVKNLVTQREKLREKFRHEFITVPPDPGAIPYEDQLLMRILQVIRENLSDPGFRIDSLAGELHISRAQLYRKIESLTGYKPGELLRTIRLRAAASLFREGHKNVARVMYMVGFSNQSNFARSFRKLFNTNPAAYIREHN